MYSLGRLSLAQISKFDTSSDFVWLKNENRWTPVGILLDSTLASEFTFFEALEYRDASRRHVKCIPCAAAYPSTWGKKWILYTSRKSHLDTADHRYAVAQVNAQQQHLQRLRDEHAALLQAQLQQCMQNHCLPSLSVQAPMNIPPKPSGPVNPTFWHLSNDDFIIDAVDDPEAHLRQSVTSAFGSWDSKIGQEFVGTPDDFNINNAEDGQEDDLDLLEIIAGTGNLTCPSSSSSLD